MRGLLTSIALCFLVVTATSCSTNAQVDDAHVPVTVDGKQLVLEASLSQDLQPVAAEGRLVVFITVRTADGSPMPSSVCAETLRLVQGDEEWVASVHGERSRSNADRYEVVVRSGPKWSEGSLVDVTLRVRDSRGQSVSLLAARQPIVATH